MAEANDRADFETSVGECVGNFKILGKNIAETKRQRLLIVDTACKCGRETTKQWRTICGRPPKTQWCSLDCSEKMKLAYSGAIGKKFGELTPIRLVKGVSGKGQKWKLVCTCECDENVKEFEVIAQHVVGKKANTQSCGCVKEAYQNRGAN